MTFFLMDLFVWILDWTSVIHVAVGKAVLEREEEESLSLSLSFWRDGMAASSVRPHPPPLQTDQVQPSLLDPNRTEQADDGLHRGTERREKAAVRKKR